MRLDNFFLPKCQKISKTNYLDNNSSTKTIANFLAVKTFCLRQDKIFLWNWSVTLIYQGLYFLKLWPINPPDIIGEFFLLMFKFVFKIELTLLKILSISKRRTTVKVSSRSILWNRIFERFFNQIFSSTLTKFSITQPQSCFI